MLKKVGTFFIIILSNATSVFASFVASPGYFDVPKDNEYLGLSNMNKEFKITSLMNSAIINDYKAAEIFINTGANVNDRNIANVTPLHLASRNEAHETAQILLRHGAIVDPRDDENWTPLMRASLAGDLEMIKILMGYGAGAWNQNNFGDTPVVHAAMADCYECVKYILENAGDYPYSSLLNMQLRKALDIANKRYNEPMIKLLKDMLNNGKGNNGKFNFGENDNLNPNGDSNGVSRGGQYNIDGTRTIVELVYIFMGRTISVEEIEEMGKKAYINSQKSNYDRREIDRSMIKCSNGLQNCKRIKIKDETVYKLSRPLNNMNSTEKKNTLHMKDKKNKNYNLIPSSRNINNNRYNLGNTNNTKLNNGIGTNDTIIVID